MRANQVVLATNGYTAHLWPELQGLIVPLRGHVTAQRPGSGLPQPLSFSTPQHSSVECPLPTTYSFIYDGSYEYMIPRPHPVSFFGQYAGDIVIGGASEAGPQRGLLEFGNTDDTAIEPAIVSALEQRTADKYFGHSKWGDDHPDGRVRRAWNGIMGYTADGMPFIGEVAEGSGLFVAAGFLGHGMVLCLSCAEALKAMMGGIEEERREKLAEWFPNGWRYSKERLAVRFEGRLTEGNPSSKKVEEQASGA